MAFSSTCPKCGASSFEIVEREPKGAAYKYLYVQCSSCGCVVGVTEFYNIGALVKELPGSVYNRLDTIQHSITSMEYTLSQLVAVVNRIKH